RRGDRARRHLLEHVRAAPVIAEPPSLGDERDARAIPEPRRGGARRPDVDVADPGQSRKLLDDDRPLGLALGLERDVLPLAAAAATEDGADRGDPRGPGAADARDLGAEIAPGTRGDACLDLVAGRRQRDEYDLALVARERVGAEREALDGEDRRRRRIGGHT